MQNSVLYAGSAEVAAAHDMTVLDDSDEWSAFGRPDVDDAALWHSHLVIEGMHCAACAHSVERALRSVPGVLQVEVNGVSGRAAVSWSAETTRPSAWMAAVKQAGYGVLPALDNDEFSRRDKAQKLALWRWLVAGFCMMQVMMYAAPAYVAHPGEMTPDIEHLLRWASLLLTLPVMLFSCRPFFDNAWRDLRHRRISMDLPVSLGIIITFTISSIATFVPSGWWAEAVYFDSVTMFVFFLLTGRWLETRLRNRTAGALDDLMRRLPESTERQVAAGVFERVSIKRIVAGDIVRVLPGEAFPVDGVIIEGETMADEALLTGESRPVSKAVESEVIAASYNLSSAVLMRVLKLGRHTRYAQIVALMEKAATDKPRLAIIADRVARPFLALVLLAALGAVIYWWPTDPARGLMAAVAVLVVTCPCALSLSTPAAMLAAAGALAKRGVLVSRLQALEAMAEIDTAVFDKTGTLTHDRMHATDIRVRPGFAADEAAQLAAAMGRHSLHPVSRALAAMATTSMQHLDSVEEISGRGLIAQTQSGEVRLGSARFCGVDVLPSAGMQVHMADAQGWLASFALGEDIRQDALLGVQQLQDAGVTVEVLSGDRLAAVQKVADALGIKQVAAENSPQDKLTHIQQLQQAGRKVLMVGDGLNDGPVLAGAHVSIAVGQAAPLARSHSDFIVLGGQLVAIPQLLSQSRRTMRIVRQNLLWAAAYNAVCIPLAVTGWINAWMAGLGMALSSLLVIMNAARLSEMRDEK